MWYGEAGLVTVDLNLIPFGLNPQDGTFVDVADVSQDGK